MGRIPKKLNDELNLDPEYRVSMLSGEAGTREDPIERHHNLIFAGSQVQERFAILALKRSEHEKATAQQLKARLDWIMLNRATDAELLHYSKAEDLFRKRAMLNRAFGKWKAPMSSKIFY